MAGTRTGKQYEELRTTALRIAHCLEQECGLTVFFAGQNAKTKEVFDEPDFSLIEDMEALQQSTYFLLLYPERLVSSVLVEAGMAIALEKKAVYFVRDPKHLPFILRHLDRVRPVKIYEYKTVDRILKLLRDHKARLFEPWAEQRHKPIEDSLATSEAVGYRPLQTYRPEDRVGPYTLLRPLGQGTFGVVWLAEKRSSLATTQVAIKFPLAAGLDLAAVKNEAEVWVRASGHPNVLPVIEADIYDGHVAIVTEYATDGSLAAWLTRHWRPESAMECAVALCSGILSGLAHLHSRGLVHRDLKPANVLLQGEVPRIADFGLARILQSVDQTCSIGGTPAYMAPEAWEGIRSERTDLWSVGVILYELLAGRRPFLEDELAEVRQAVLTHEPAPLPASIPTELVAVVRKALSKDPAARFQSAIEMRTDLLIRR